MYSRTELGVVDIDSIPALRNDAHQPFLLQGVPIASMAGFFNGIRYEDSAEQNQYFTRFGPETTRASKDPAWMEKQTLYFKGEAYPRESWNYRDLCQEAMRARYDANPEFASLLEIQQESGSLLVWDKGLHNPSQTVITESELLATMDVGRLRHGQEARIDPDNHSRFKGALVGLDSCGDGLTLHLRSDEVNCFFAPEKFKRPLLLHCPGLLSNHLEHTLGFSCLDMWDLAECHERTFHKLTHKLEEPDYPDRFCADLRVMTREHGHEITEGMELDIEGFLAANPLIFEGTASRKGFAIDTLRVGLTHDGEEPRDLDWEKWMSRCDPDKAERRSKYDMLRMPQPEPDLDNGIKIPGERRPNRSRR